MGVDRDVGQTKPPFCFAVAKRCPHFNASVTSNTYPRMRPWCSLPVQGQTAKQSFWGIRMGGSHDPSHPRSRGIPTQAGVRYYGYYSNLSRELRQKISQIALIASPSPEKLFSVSSARGAAVQFKLQYSLFITAASWRLLCTCEIWGEAALFREYRWLLPLAIILNFG